MPCWRLFDEQDARYTRAKSLVLLALTLPSKRPRLSAGSAILARSGIFVGIDHFGASAPYKELYKAFGITAEKAAEAALAGLRKKD
jgi:transketolase